MDVRIFKENDTEAVVDLWERCGLTVPWNDPRKDIDRKLMVQPELFLVGVSSNTIVGTVMGGYDGHRGWLYYLAIDPDYQHHGLGSFLITEIEKRLAALGCPKINLMVRTRNEKVIAFYKSRGYEVDDIVGLGKRIIPD